MKTKQNCEIMNVQEACRLLNLSRQTICKHVQAGKIPGKKVGRKYLFSRRALLIWLRGDWGLDSGQSF